jgi:glycosyltransferase involved in cell wall biosynthesis
LVSWICGAVVSARDEEKAIGKTLQSLRNQTVRVFIVVVNDGSKDRTRDVASRYADVVLDLPRHAESWVGKPELARVFNAGFEVLRDRNVEYVLISGADSVYPANYVENTIKRMKGGDIVFASGVAEGEVSRSLSPRGSGRVIDARWFGRVGFRYPENYGFEFYPVYKALSEDRKVTVFQDLRFKLSRGTGVSRKKLYLWGKGMKALNYWSLYAIGRAVLTGFRNPLNGFALLEGYVSEVPKKYDDLRQFVPNFQKRLFITRMREVLKS